MTNPDTSTPELVTSDQTAFGSTEPLFENHTEVIDPHASPIEPNKPYWKNPLILVAGIVALALVLLLTLLIMTITPSRRQATSEPTPSPVNEMPAGPWQERTTTLQSELEAADPSQQELPFPPVKMELPLVVSKR